MNLFFLSIFWTGWKIIYCYVTFRKLKKDSWPLSISQCKIFLLKRWEGRYYVQCQSTLNGFFYFPVKRIVRPAQWKLRRRWWQYVQVLICKKRKKKKNHEHFFLFFKYLLSFSFQIKLQGTFVSVSIPALWPGPFMIWDIDLKLDKLMLLSNIVTIKIYTHRFDYSPEFLRWALLPPGFLKEWHVGVRWVGIFSK